MTSLQPTAIRLLYDKDKISERLDPFSLILDFAESNIPILISGEAGSGKKWLALYAHHSVHRQGRFVSANIQGMDPDMQMALLFGGPGRKGLVEEAEEGTLYLDEVANLAPQVQLRLGGLISHGNPSMTPSKAPRIIAGTRCAVSELMASSTLRTSILYNLARVHLRMPPTHFLLKSSFQVLATQWSIEVVQTRPVFTSGFLQRMEQVRTSGNLHELKSLIQRACLIARNRPDTKRTVEVTERDLVDALVTGLGLSEEYRTLRAFDAALRLHPDIKQSDLAAYHPKGMESTDVVRLFIDCTKDPQGGMKSRTRLGISLEIWKAEFPVLNDWLQLQTRESRRKKGAAAPGDVVPKDAVPSALLQLKPVVPKAVAQPVAAAVTGKSKSVPKAAAQKKAIAQPAAAVAGKKKAVARSGSLATS